jgi:beta-glucosidase
MIFSVYSVTRLNKAGGKVNTSSVSPYLDPTLPVEERVNDLVSRMTLPEKVSQMVHDAAAIERLGVPAYNWWNECLHGLARSGTATVFPQAIGLAATWNPALVGEIATAISDEGRARYHQSVRQGIRTIYHGLTFWTPNINIFRDPRWGRGQETYGEDPYLTARLGVEFVKGLQGDHPKYLKSVATPKHYAVHSGPEFERHHFDAHVSRRDLFQTYLYAFKACVQEAHAEAIMGAYNRTNGQACCASSFLLEKILRQDWGFSGHVVSDCGAIDDIYKHHQLVSTAEEASALAVRSGCDLNCGHTYPSLLKAYSAGLVGEEAIDRAVRRLFRARFRLGMFDPDAMVPYANISPEVIDSPAHRSLALEAARQSIVLLKNTSDFLPLDGRFQSIAVIGPNADDELVLRGNYYGHPAGPVTILSGLAQRVGRGVQIGYCHGCEIRDPDRKGFSEAVDLALRSDLVIAVMGLSQLVEGEEGQSEGNLPGTRSLGDRSELELPGVQEQLLQQLAATGKPVVLVLLNGSAVAVNWAQASPQVPAILEAWYPGQAGGTAVAEVLFGDYNPSGRLPVTFYQSAAQLPPFTDYAMEGHTYRYFGGAPLYPFGFGLSYTDFEYQDLSVERNGTGEEAGLQVRFRVTNAGKRPGSEVAQLYLQDCEASVPVPACELKRFQRLHLQPGESQILEFSLSQADLSCFDDDGTAFFEPGQFQVWVGGHSPALYGSVASLSPLRSATTTL